MSRTWFITWDLLTISLWTSQVPKDNRLSSRHSRGKGKDNENTRTHETQSNVYLLATAKAHCSRNVFLHRITLLSWPHGRGALALRNICITRKFSSCLHGHQHANCRTANRVTQERSVGKVFKYSRFPESVSSFHSDHSSRYSGEKVW